MFPLQLRDSLFSGINNLVELSENFFSVMSFYNYSFKSSGARPATPLWMSPETTSQLPKELIFTTTGKKDRRSRMSLLCAMGTSSASSGPTNPLTFSFGGFSCSRCRFEEARLTSSSRNPDWREQKAAFLSSWIVRKIFRSRVNYEKLFRN